MQHFLVSSSILSTPHLGTWVQQQWELAVTGCKLLRAGINHSYLITTEADKYVLRIYSLGWRSTTDITEEIRLINMLAENGVPVSRPMPMAFIYITSQHPKVKDMPYYLPMPWAIR